MYVFNDLSSLDNTPGFVFRKCVSTFDILSNHQHRYRFPLAGGPALYFVVFFVTTKEGLVLLQDWVTGLSFSAIIFILLLLNHDGYRVGRRERRIDAVMIFIYLVIYRLTIRIVDSHRGHTEEVVSWVNRTPQAAHRQVNTKMYYGWHRTDNSTIPLPHDRQQQQYLI